jgi:hypothetical protein
MVKEIEFKKLVGVRTLDAVDLRMATVHGFSGEEGSANAIAFRLDGVSYIAVEDEQDGYRSSMRYLTTTTDPMVNVFPPCKVVGRMRETGDGGDHVLELIDATTGKVVLEVGTENVGDYYPGFVSAFHPENMAVNAPEPEPVPEPRSSLESVAGYGEWA